MLACVGEIVHLHACVCISVCVCVRERERERGIFGNASIRWLGVYLEYHEIFDMHTRDDIFFTVFARNTKSSVGTDGKKSSYVSL